VVGVLLAALCSPIVPAGVRSPADAALAVLAFAALEVWKLPPWVVLGALAGWGAAMRPG
jgi:chromate transporter